MSGVPASSRSFNGGTITEPLVIDLSAKGTQNVNPLSMILSADWPFTGDAVKLAIGSDTPLRFSGAASNWDLGGFNLLTNNGALGAGTLRAFSGAGDQFSFGAGGVDATFFGHAAVTRPTGVAVTAAAIHAALVTLGLITA